MNFPPLMPYHFFKLKFVISYFTEVMEMIELYQEFEKATAARWKYMFLCSL